MTQDEARRAAHLLLGPSTRCTPRGSALRGEHHTAICLRLQASELAHARELAEVTSDRDEGWREAFLEGLRSAHEALTALPCVGIATVPYLAALTACRSAVAGLVEKVKAKGRKAALSHDELIAKAQERCAAGIEICDPSCLHFGGAIPVPCETCPECASVTATVIRPVALKPEDTKNLCQPIGGAPTKSDGFGLS